MLIGNFDLDDEGGRDSKFGSRNFAANLTSVVLDRWLHFVSGDYARPPCPPENLLTELLEVAYLTASAPEEGRYPRFNIVATPVSSNPPSSQVCSTWQFDE